MSKNSLDKTKKPSDALTKYAAPANPALPKSTMRLDLSRAALVVIDPQVDFMSPNGLAWPMTGESVTEQNIVPNLVRILQASKASGIPVAVSPHYYWGTDHAWKIQAPIEAMQKSIKLFDRKSALDLEGFENSGSDFMPEFKPYINDGKTVICSPHKLYGPQISDLNFQLRKQLIDQVILTGMLANLCVESHLRELLEQGYEVAVISDAVAGPKIPEGDGYLAAIINFRFMANAVWTTDEFLTMLHASAEQ